MARSKFATKKSKAGAMMPKKEMTLEDLRERSQKLATPFAIDLVSKIMQYKPRHRSTASQALKSGYFKSIRNFNPRQLELDMEKASKKKKEVKAAAAASVSPESIAPENYLKNIAKPTRNANETLPKDQAAPAMAEVTPSKFQAITPNAQVRPPNAQTKPPKAQATPLKHQATPSKGNVAPIN